VRLVAKAVVRSKGVLVRVGLEVVRVGGACCIAQRSVGSVIGVVGGVCRARVSLAGSRVTGGTVSGLRSARNIMVVEIEEPRQMAALTHLGVVETECVLDCLHCIE
jgi:hypothetical protein